MHGPSKPNLLFKEGRVILLGGQAHRIMFRVKRLDEHATRSISAARAARRLRQTLKRSRRGETAVVADEPVLAAVVGEGDRAIRAAHRLAAAPAQEKPGEAAPVEQDHGLRAGL